MGELLDQLDKLVAAAGSTALRSEDVARLRDRVQTTEQQLAALAKENAALKEKLAQCESQLAAYAAREEFVEHRGALFKRKPGGGYQLAVYCPNCRQVASAMDRHFPISCNRCGWAVGFSPADLERVLKELP